MQGNPGSSLPKAQGLPTAKFFEKKTNNKTGETLLMEDKIQYT